MSETADIQSPITPVPDTQSADTVNPSPSKVSELASINSAATDLPVNLRFNPEQDASQGSQGISWMSGSSMQMREGRGLWKVRNMVRIYAAMHARRDFKAVEQSLSLLPLYYKDPKMEAKFVQYIGSHDIMKFQQVASWTIGIMTSLWVYLSIGIITAMYPISSLTSQILFHVSFVVVLSVFVGAALGIGQSIDYYYIEKLCVYIGPVIYVVPNLWVLFNAIQSSNDTTPVTVALIMQRIKLWTIPVVLGMPLFEFLYIYLMLQSRTAAIFIPRMVYLSIYTVSSTITAYKYMRNEQGGDISFAGRLTFYVIVSSMEVVSLVLCVFMCFFGRWCVELTERIEFWKLDLTRTQLEALKGIGTRSKTSGATAVEDLLNIIMRAMSCIQDADNVLESPLLSESINTLRSVQNILTNSDSLYAVKFAVAKSGGSAIQEDGAMEANYMQMYGAVNRASATPYSPQITKDLRTQVTGGDVTSSNVVPSVAPVPVADAEFRRGVGTEWSYNMLLAARNFKNIMVELSTILLEPLSDSLETSPIHMRNLVFKLERTYRDNPYHNKAHAAMVAHCLNCLLHMSHVASSSTFSRRDHAIAILGALAHDVGHPGRNNQFFINSFQPLSLVYNDRSVLENYHVALTFKIMQIRAAAILDKLDPENFGIVRRQMIELILCTDMSHHFEFISKMRLRRQAQQFDFLLDTEDLWLVVKACLKAADLGHAMVPWMEHVSWSLMICEEFYQQGEEEAALGLTKSPLCDRAAHKDFCKTQGGFLEFVVQPLVGILGEVDKMGHVADNCTHNLAYNKLRWSNLARQADIPSIDSSVSQKRTNSKSVTIVLNGILLPKGYRYESPKQAIVAEESSKSPKPTAVKTTPTGVPAKTSPTGVPAKTSPTGVPAKTSPTGVPAKTSPTGVPEKDKPRMSVDGEDVFYMLADENEPEGGEDELESEIEHEEEISEHSSAAEISEHSSAAEISEHSSAAEISEHSSIPTFGAPSPVTSPEKSIAKITAKSPIVKPLNLHLIDFESHFRGAT